MATRATTFSSTASWMSSRSKRRLVEPRDWPCQVKFIPRTAAAATVSGSASGKTIIGFLPPNSSVTCFTASSAAARWRARPVSGEPMKAMRRMPGWRTMASPTVRPWPVTMLKTPAGSASRATSARMSAESGLVSGGLTTSTFGRACRARAKSTFCWLPPESVAIARSGSPAGRTPKAARSVSARSASGGGAAAARRGGEEVLPRSQIGEGDLAPVAEHGVAADGAGRGGLASASGRPPISTAPAAGRSMPASQRQIRS